MRNFWIGSAVLMIVLVGLLLIGCGGPVHNPDPTPALSSEIDSAGSAVKSADTQLSQTPPAVPGARLDLQSATRHIDKAKVETVKVSDKFNQVEADRVKLETENKAIKASWLSPRQKSELFWLISGIVLFGILAAVGNFFPGWWSLPALWLMKAVRFAVFGGIPHLVSLVVYLVKRVVSLFHKPEVPPNLTFGSPVVPTNS